MTLWACLVLLLLLASPDGVEAAKKKKRKKTKNSSTASTGTGGSGSSSVRKKARPSRGEADLDDDDVSHPSSSSSDRAGGGAGAGAYADAIGDDSDSSLFREPLPETRDDALVFHSESTPESKWSWRATKRRFAETWEGMSGMWEGISASAGTVAEKLHLPSKREREMVWYYARLIGSRIKSQWDSVDWDRVAEEIPEIKGFRRTWSEFRNATGFTTGWTSVLATPVALVWTGCKWAAALGWSMLTSPFTTVYRLLRWLTSTWWSTLLGLFVGWVLYEGAEVKVKVTPSGMPKLPEDAEEVQRVPRKGYYTLDNFPKNLRGRQMCAKDVWACVRVNRGRLRYQTLADPGEGLDKEKELTYMNGGGIAPPQLPFEIAPVPGEKKLQFRIVYYRTPPPPQDVAVAGGPAADATAARSGRRGGASEGGPKRISFKWGGRPEQHQSTS